MFLSLKALRTLIGFNAPAKCFLHSCKEMFVSLKTNKKIVLIFKLYLHIKEYFIML